MYGRKHVWIYLRTERIWLSIHAKSEKARSNGDFHVTNKTRSRSLNHHHNNSNNKAQWGGERKRQGRFFAAVLRVRGEEKRNNAGEHGRESAFSIADKGGVWELFLYAS